MWAQIRLLLQKAVLSGPTHFVKKLLKQQTTKEDDFCCDWRYCLTPQIIITALTMAGLSAPIIAVLWEDFEVNQHTFFPGLFKDTPGEITPDDNKCLYLEQGMDNKKSG